MQELELRDIYEIMTVPLWRTPWFVAGVVVVLLITGIVLWYFLKKRAFAVKVVSPFEQALTDLKQLQKNELSSPKLLYIQLTSLLKRYLEAVYELSLMGTTDDEMMETLKRSDSVPEEIVTQLDRLLHGVVLIKFANQKVADGHMKKAVIECIELVKIIESSIQNKKRAVE